MIGHRGGCTGNTGRILGGLGGCVCTGLGWDRGEMDGNKMDDKGMRWRGCDWIGLEMTGGCVC